MINEGLPKINDAKIKNILLKLDEDMNDEFEKNKQNLFSKIESVLLKGQKKSKKSKNKKVKIPKIFNVNEKQFMTCELVLFSDVAKKESYKKVISSLNYLAKSSANKDFDILERIKEIKLHLKNLKAAAKQFQDPKAKKALVQEPCEQPKNENMSKSSEAHLPTSEDA